jgi:hypothetical protein
MKRTSTIFSLLIVASIISGALSANGQDRKRDQDGDRNRDRSDHRDHNNGDQRDRYADNNDRRGHRDRDRRHDRRVVKHVYHHHDRYCNHGPVVVHHHHIRPRYIYYRDYDVYYDSHRSVYISYSGRGWTLTTALPTAMRHVNIRTTKRFEVDYHDDDFPRYLETRRPSYGRECDDW